MGLFNDNANVTTTFKGKDQLSPVVRNIRSAMADFKKDAITGFGLGAGLNLFTLGASAVSAFGQALVGTVDAARGWETAMTGVEKTLDTTGLTVSQAERAIGDLASGLRSMAMETPIAVQELAALAEAGGALGIARKDLLEFTRTAALMGTTTDIAATDAATALGKIGAVMPFTREEYSRFAATLVDLGNKGASTEREIVEMAQNMAGAAALIGMSKADLLGWASALANVGEEAEAGGSSFQRLALQMNAAAESGGQRMQAFADAAGMASDALSDLWTTDSSEALRRIVQGLGRMDKNARQASLSAMGLTDIRITRALLSLSSNVDNLNKALEVAPAAWSENTAAAVEAEKRYATLDSKLQIVNNRMHDVSITVGEVITEALHAAIDVADRFGVALGDINANLDPASRAAAKYERELVSLAKVYGLDKDALLAYNREQMRGVNTDKARAAWVQRLQTHYANLGDTVKNELIGGLEASLRQFATGAGLDFIDVLETAEAQLANFSLADPAVGTGEMARLLAVLSNKYGLVTDSTGKFINATDAAREMVQDFRVSMLSGRDIAAIIGGWGESVSGIGPGFGEMTRTMRRFAETAPKLMGHAVTDMKAAIENGRTLIVEQFRLLAWQSKHPFAEVRYANWLKNQEEKALRRMKRANDRGMPGLAAQHRQLAADIRAEYQGLPGYMASIAGKVVGALSIIPGMGGLDDILNWSPPTKPRKRKRKRNAAQGGSASGTTMVGEYGPELLHLGSAKARVTPNHQMGGPIVLQIDGHTLMRWIDNKQGRQMALYGLGD